jgi:dihydrolipoamide dehydrogenase
MTYDVAIIGSGPGGYSAAVRAGQYGLQTAIIEKDPKLGGTCLHVGCIPTKAMLQSAEFWEYFLHSVEQGIHCDNPRLDLPLVLDRKNKIVSKHAKGVEFLMKKNKVDVIAGFGVIKGGGKIDIRPIAVCRPSRPATILATGSEARMLPGMSADEMILTNIEILPRRWCRRLGRHWRGAVGVEFGLDLPALRNQMHDPRSAAAPGAGEDKTSRRN